MRHRRQQRATVRRFPQVRGTAADFLRRRYTRRWGTRSEQMMASRELSQVVRLRSVFADAGIGSSAALEAYLAVIYRRDPEVFHHARRAAWISAFIASSIGVRGPFLGDIERAALLHEIGMLATRGMRAGAGSEQADELGRAQLAAHDILIATPFLAPAAAIVLAVREHYDGSGSPFGLRTSEIPLGARVVAIADAFDALVFAPTAPDAASVGAANARLVREAGSTFDPMLIRAWLRALDRLGTEPAGPGDAGARTKQVAASPDGVTKRRIQCS